MFPEDFFKVRPRVGQGRTEFVIGGVGFPLIVGGGDGLFPDVESGGGECEVDFFGFIVVVGVILFLGIGVGDFFDFVIVVVDGGVFGVVDVVRRLEMVGGRGGIGWFGGFIVVAGARVVVVQGDLDGIYVHPRGAFEVSFFTAFLLQTIVRRRLGRAGVVRDGGRSCHGHGRFQGEGCCCYA